MAHGEDPHISWALSRVSRWFRHLALGTSPIWSNIDIMYGQRRVTLSLERSGAALVDVTASLPLIKVGRENNWNQIRSFMSQVAPVASRLRSLRMVYTMWSYLEVAVPLIPASLPALDLLDIGVRNQVLPSWMEDRERLAARVLSCQPSRLFLRGNPVWAVQNNLFSRVRTFEYRSPSCTRSDHAEGPDRFLLWLQNMSGLETLVLEDFDRIAQIGSSELEGEQPVTLPVLREVRIESALGA